MHVNITIVIMILAAVVVVATYVRGIYVRRKHMMLLVQAEDGDNAAIKKIWTMNNDASLLIKKCDRSRVIKVIEDEKARLALLEDECRRADELQRVEDYAFAWSKPDKDDDDCVDLIFRYLVGFVGKLKYDENKIRAFQRFDPDFEGPYSVWSCRVLWISDAQQRFDKACGLANNDDAKAFVMAQKIRSLVNSRRVFHDELGLRLPGNWDNLVVYFVEVPTVADFRYLTDYGSLPKGTVSMLAAEGVGRGDLIMLLTAMACCNYWSDCRTEVGDVLYADVVREVKRIRSRAGSFYR